MEIHEDVTSVETGEQYEDSATLLGNSVFDTLPWIAGRDDPARLAYAKEHTVAHYLGTMLHGKKVYNLAYDGLTTEGVLGSDIVGRILSEEFGELWGDARHYIKARIGDEPVEVRPLEQLKERIANHPNGTNWVAMAVEGNDFREKLGGNPLGLLREIAGVQQRYIEIADQVRECGGTPIFAFQYRTDRTTSEPYDIYRLFDNIGKIAGVATIGLAALGLIGAGSALISGLSLTSACMMAVGGLGLFGLHQLVPLSTAEDLLSGKDMGVALYGRLMERLYQPMIEYAMKHKIAILDLPNTFNPNKSTNYTCEIEPSEEGSRLIAEGIAHIVENHDPAGESRFYYKPFDGTEYQSRPATRSWKVEYPPAA